MTYDAGQRQTLLGLARSAIEHGLERQGRLRVDPADYDEVLQQKRACFVTLHSNRRLRGCIGSLEAYRPLVEDVASNAHAAAFSDPRFAPLSRPEFADLDLSISVLGPASPLSFASEQELIGMLRPGQDGLILSVGARRGTFLPSVWEQVPEAGEFLRHLKQKAGLAPDFWSDEVRVSRYGTESFSWGSAAMNRMRFSLDIDYDEFLAVYQGAARFVQTVADDGRSLRFPASALTPYLEHRGIHGRFEICFDRANKLQSLRKL